MKNWKKAAIAVVVLVLAVLIGIEVRMESRFSYWKDETVSVDVEEIVRKVPEVNITEDDCALLEEVAQYPAVREWIQSGEGSTDCPDIAEDLQKYLHPDCAASINVSLLHHDNWYSLVLDWENGKTRTSLEKTLSTEEYQYYKIFMPEEKVYYRNQDNQQVQKVVTKRQWFAWLRDEFEESGKNGE